MVCCLTDISDAYSILIVFFYTQNTGGYARRRLSVLVMGSNKSDIYQIFIKLITGGGRYEGYGKGKTEKAL